ncbi:MAG: hypothetical protein HC904_08185 [Blastochloris sp.]|nr:hypothetical protein [Blastochloris sp.]
MLDITDKFATSDGPPLNGPEWTEERNKNGEDQLPVCYKRESSPKMTVEFKIDPSLGSNKAKVKIKAKATQEDQNLEYKEEELELTGDTATLTDHSVKDSSQKLKDVVFNGPFECEWEVSHDGGGENGTFSPIQKKVSIPLYATYDTPVGVLSKKRMDFVCKKAHNTDDDVRATNRLVPEIMTKFDPSNTYFEFRPNFSTSLTQKNLHSLWQVLDDEKADCKTLCHSMKEALNLIGHNTPKVTYIYACHKDWSNIEQSEGSSDNCETAHPHYSILIYLSPGQSGAFENYFEACLLVGNVYYLGGTAITKDTNKDVLRSVAGSSGHLQRWQIYPNTPVPFPSHE